ncbi:MAG: YunC family protein [Dehalococcoidia bacterium]|nr:YunC family protein [Dehalococcoidia bacterium]
MEPAQTVPQAAGTTVHQKVQLTNKQADGYVIPFRNVKIVCVITDVGMVGCGAFDVAALDSFACPAARVKSSTGNPIATVEDLLQGTVKEANAEAGKLGIKVGMTGREALDLL